MSNLVWNTIDAEYGTFDWLRRELCVKIGYNADHRLLNKSERSYVDSIIESGVMQFCISAFQGFGDDWIEMVDFGVNR